MLKICLSMEVKFWGVRGSIATPGKNTARIGGNTSCVEVSEGKHRLILDGGTGLRALGDTLIKSEQPEYHILISHFHFDHICGLPFFTPLYQSQAKIHFYGPKGLKTTLRKTLDTIFSENYFPVPFAKLPSQLFFHTCDDSHFKIGPFAITAQRLNHPGKTLGFRISVTKKTLVYLTDNEPISGHDHIQNNIKTKNYEQKIKKLLQDADILIHDAHFLDHEYKNFCGWGHSSWNHAVQNALKHRIKTLVLFHFAPAHSDKQILSHFKSLLKKNKKNKNLEIRLAKEASCIHLD